MSTLFEIKLAISEAAEPFPFIFAIQGVIISIIGFLLTLPVLWIVYKSNWKKLHPDLFMSSILCFNNMCISIGLFFTSVFILAGQSMIVYNEYLSDAQFMFMSIPLVYNSYIIGLISIERCLLIVFNVKLDKLFYIIITVILILIPLSIGIWSLVVSGHTTISISGVHSTVPPSKNSRFYILMLYLILGLLSVISVFISYTAIVISRFKQLSRNRRDLNIGKHQILKDKMVIILKSSLILIVFLAIHFGKVVMLFMDSILQKHRGFLIDAVAENLLIYSVISDVLLLLFMDIKVRRKFFIILRIKQS